MYRILVAGEEREDWRELGRGPWENPRSALQYAESEVGAPWLVVDQGNRPVGYGSGRNVAWSRLRSRDPHRESVAKFFFLELQYNNVREPDRFHWADSEEGPFDSAAEAIEFAKSECGLPCAWSTRISTATKSSTTPGTRTSRRPSAGLPVVQERQLRARRQPQLVVHRLRSGVLEGGGFGDPHGQSQSGSGAKMLRGSGLTVLIPPVNGSGPRRGWLGRLSSTG